MRLDLLATLNAKVEKFTKDSDGKNALFWADLKGPALVVEDNQVHSYRSVNEMMDACEKHFKGRCGSFLSLTLSHENYTKVYKVKSVKKDTYKGKQHVLRVELEKLEEVTGVAAKKATDFSGVNKGDNVSMTFVGNKENDENEEPEDEDVEKTIAELVEQESKLSTLETALKAADLDETLDDEVQEFTVFAPTNDAFNKLPFGTLIELLKKKNKSKLVILLKDHVVKGKLTSKELAKKSSVRTLSGKKLKVKNSGSKLMVGGVTVQDADIEASNGVVHTLDNVILCTGPYAAHYCQ